MRNRLVVSATWDNAPHLSEEAKARTLASIPPYLRDARSRGIPQLGSGAILPVPQSEITCKDFEIPATYARGFAMDAGGGAKPTAAVYGALDRETDVLYIYSCYKRASAEPAIHLNAMLAKGKWIPGVGDASNLILTTDDAEQLVKIYQRGGLNLRLANKAVESGLTEVWQRLSTGRLRVFASCDKWFEEHRLYRRDENGRIVKVNDHLMDATRYLCYSGIARMITKPAEEKETGRDAYSLDASAEHNWMRQ